MSRSRSAGSDGSDNEGDGAAEHEMELQKLQRQYRLLENDRNAYAQESQEMLRKQMSEIDKLTCENDELKKDLQLIENNNRARNDKLCENLSELGRRKRDIEQEIEEEKKRQQELDAQIREMEKKVREQQTGGGRGESGGNDRKASGGGGSSSAGKKSASTKHRSTRKLEDQLQLANNKFGKLLEENSSLRKEIDNLRVERQRFDNLYKKLNKEKQDLQKETNDLIDQSTQAYDQRVEAQEKMILLNEKAEKDIQQHNAEMKELVRIIDHDRKLREFMNTKSRERDEDQQLVKWRKRKEEMEAEKKKAGQTDTVESYEAAFARIKEITLKEDIDLIVRQFIEVEDENFALFNFVNDQNNRIEHLQEEISEIQSKISTFNSEGTQLELQRQSILKELEARQLSYSKQADDYDEKSVALNKILDQVKSGVESLFTKIGCERSAIDDLLGVQDGVTEQNLLQYLGIVESRTNQLLLTHAYIQKRNKPESKEQAILLGEGPQPQSQGLSIIPPAVGDEYDSDASGSAFEDENRPQTRSELMNKAMKSVVKRETAMKKQGFQYDLTDVQDRSKKDKHAKPKAK